MVITDQIIDQAFSDLKSQCGGVRNDYFGLVYLQREFEIDRDQAITQVAFGGNDYVTTAGAQKVFAGRAHLPGHGADGSALRLVCRSTQIIQIARIRLLELPAKVDWSTGRLFRSR